MKAQNVRRHQQRIVEETGIDFLAGIPARIDVSFQGGFIGMGTIEQAFLDTHTPMPT